MRAMFVACCLALLVGVAASPVQARAFCKFKNCPQTSIQKAVHERATTSVHKGARRQVAAHVHKSARNASAQALKHRTSKVARKKSVRATKTVSELQSLKSASRECAPGETCDGVVSGGSQLIRLALAHLGGNPTGWSHNWCGRFLAMTLEEAGHRGGGNLAAAYRDYGKPAKAQVGAIAVMQHHVGLVTAVGPDYVVLLSGNHGHKVGVGRYASNTIIAYRMVA
jgi:uncharacterized protein (TIGR02594 family)